MKRPLLAVFLSISLAALDGCETGPGVTDIVQISGLTKPAEILKDRWGISHIYAENQEDLFFAQGFNIARDRLFQLEMWRRRATGTVSEIVGRRALQQDIGARLLRARVDMEKELSHYHPDGVEIITSFVSGINAYAEGRYFPVVFSRNRVESAAESKTILQPER